jgi:hypothetical protein
VPVSAVDLLYGQLIARSSMDKTAAEHRGAGSPRRLWKRRRQQLRAHVVETLDDNPCNRLSPRAFPLLQLPHRRPRTPALRVSSCDMLDYVRIIIEKLSDRSIWFFK